MQTRTEIEARAREVIATQMALDPSKITAESTFADLGADSLDRIDCTFSLEEEFDLEIPDQDADEMATFGAVVEWLVKRLGVEQVAA